MRTAPVLLQPTGCVWHVRPPLFVMGQRGLPVQSAYKVNIRPLPARPLPTECATIVLLKHIAMV